MYVVMSWATADNLSRASGNLHIANGWSDVGQTARAFVSNNIWRAPVAAAALGGLMVVLFNLLSCGVLLRCARAPAGGALAAAVCMWQCGRCAAARAAGRACLCAN